MKSADITKYNLAWQMVRVQCRDFKSTGEKINHAEAFLKANANRHNYERVMNWLEGLKRGYINRNEFAVEMCQAAIDDLKENAHLYSAQEDTEVNISNYSLSDVKSLYNDLQKRSLKWLAGGYHHKEQEAFLDMLVDHLTSNGVSIKNHNKLVEARQYAKLMSDDEKKSTFFF